MGGCGVREDGVSGTGFLLFVLEICLVKSWDKGFVRIFPFVVYTQGSIRARGIGGVQGAFLGRFWTRVVDSSSRYSLRR